MLLHKSPTSGEKRASNSSESMKHEELTVARDFVENLLKESLRKLVEDDTDSDIFVRWELGACWIQHLQDQNNAEKDKKQGGEKDKKQSTEKSTKETRIEGLGKPLKVLKNSKKIADASDNGSLSDRKLTDEVGGGESKKANLPSGQSEGESKATGNESRLRELLSETAFMRLKESETGLHLKVITIVMIAFVFYGIKYIIIAMIGFLLYGIRYIIARPSDLVDYREPFNCKQKYLALILEIWLQISFV